MVGLGDLINKGKDMATDAAKGAATNEATKKAGEVAGDAKDAAKASFDNRTIIMADRIRNLDEGVVKLEDGSRLSTYVQEALVKLGHNIGEGGPNGDGVDGDPGRSSIAAINTILKEKGIEGIKNASEFNEEHLAAIHEELRDNKHFKGRDNKDFKEEWKDIAKEDLGMDVPRISRGYFSDAADPDANADVAAVDEPDTDQDPVLAANITPPTPMG